MPIFEAKISKPSLLSSLAVIHSNLLSFILKLKSFTGNKLLFVVALAILKVPKLLTAEFVIKVPELESPLPVAASFSQPPPANRDRVSSFTFDVLTPLLLPHSKVIAASDGVPEAERVNSK